MKFIARVRLWFMNKWIDHLIMSMAETMACSWGHRTDKDRAAIKAAEDRVDLAIDRRNEYADKHGLKAHPRSPDPQDDVDEVIEVDPSFFEYEIVDNEGPIQVDPSLYEFHDLRPLDDERNNDGTS